MKFFFNFKSLMWSFLVLAITAGCSESGGVDDPAGDDPTETVNPSAPSLMVYPTSIHAPAQGGEFKIVIASSDDWTAKSENEQISFDIDNGTSEDKEIVITVAPNTSEDQQEFIATIVASNSEGSEEKNITITQTAGEAAKSNGIYSVNDFIALAEAVNNGESMEPWQDEDGVIRQKADIDMKNIFGWEAIGSYKLDNKVTFTGSFDGNGFKITNFSAIQSENDESLVFGLFGYNEGTITNVIIESGSIKGACNYIGSICARNSGVISNCVNNADVTVSSGYVSTGYIGGITSFNEESGELKNLVNRGDVLEGDSSAGISPMNKGTLESCINYGNINAIQKAGGISTYNSLLISSCENYGDIYCAENEYACGIATYNNFHCTIENCTNHGNISGEGEYMSGVVGINWSIVDNCINYGDVVGNITFASGIVASNSGDITGSKTLNTGTISGEAPFFGGIAGYNFAGGRIIGATNEGDVVANYIGADIWAGGITGYSSESEISEITGCTNSGVVSCFATNGHRAGGIVGECKISVTDCKNSGTVVGGVYTGGIVGYLNIFGHKIENCDNSGEVRSTVSANRSGGIVGQSNGSLSVLNCNNSGNVESTNGIEAGGIVTNTAYATITSCNNSGAITCNNGSVGGISSTHGVYSTMTSCKNSGDIVGGTNLGKAGGLAGAKSTNAEITDCVNEGSVNGETPGADYGREF